MSQALYRRYRPETFAEVIGQEHVTEPLMQALRTGRISHAYLFSGPRGCGKTTSARILARCLNCAQGPTDVPCGQCESCRELGRGGGGSLDVVEIDAASHNGVDDARELRERAAFAPARDRFKIFILDEAHMVTPQGFNALLKIVEEPPPHVKFIFATTEPDRVIGTIRSRTHHYPFRLVPPDKLTAYMGELCQREGIDAAPGVLPLVVRAGAGSVRDTESVLDQLIAGSATGEISYPEAIALLGYTPAELLDDVVDALGACDGAAMFQVVDRVIESGQDPRRFVEDVLERLRDLIVLAAAGQEAHAVLRSVPADALERMIAQASALGLPRLSRAGDAVNDALSEMTGATSPRLQLELMCARLLVDERPEPVPAAPTARPGAGRTGSAAGQPASVPDAGARPRPSQARPAGGEPSGPRPGVQPGVAGGGDVAGAGGSGQRGAGVGGPAGARGAGDSRVGGASGRGAGVGSTAGAGETGTGSTGRGGDADAAVMPQAASAATPGVEHGDRSSEPGARAGGSEALPVPAQSTQPSGPVIDPDDDWPDEPQPGPTGGTPTARQATAPQAADAQATTPQAASPRADGTQPERPHVADPRATAPQSAAGRAAAAPPEATPARQPAARPASREASPGEALSSQGSPAPDQTAPAEEVAPLPHPAQPVTPQPAGGHPAPQDAGGPHDINIDALRQRWPEILEQLGHIRRASWALVAQEGTLSAAHGNTVTLTFRSHGLASAFRSGHLEALREAIERVTGAAVAIAVEADEGASRGQPASPTGAQHPAPAPERGPSAHPSPQPSRTSGASSVPTTPSAPTTTGTSGGPQAASDDEPPWFDDEPVPGDEPPIDVDSAHPPAPRVSSHPAPQPAAHPRSQRTAAPARPAGATASGMVDAGDMPAEDDLELEDSGMVGPTVVAQLLGGEVIEEVVDEPQP